MAGETPADHHQDPQTPRPINLPGRLRSAQKNPPHGSQRGHLLVAACHHQSTAAAHPPALLPKAQRLLKASCTVGSLPSPPLPRASATRFGLRLLLVIAVLLGL